MTTTPPQRSRAATMSLWLAIGALVVAAIMGGYFIIVGDQANIAGRAWLTLLLVLFFAGAVVLDAQVSNGPNRWYLGASTVLNVVIVAIGLLKLWNGWLQGDNTADAFVWSAQLGRFLAVLVLLRLALLLTQVYGLYFVTRARSALGRITALVTIGMLWIAALVLVIPAAFPDYDWPDWWWRIAGAASLVAVVMAVIPLIIRAFEPKPERPAESALASGYGADYATQQAYAQQQAAWAQQQYAQAQAQQYAQPAYQPVPPEFQQQAASSVPPVPAAPVAEPSTGEPSVAAASEAAPAPEAEPAADPAAAPQEQQTPPPVPPA